MNSIVKVPGFLCVLAFCSSFVFSGGVSAADSPADPAISRMRDAMKKLAQRIVDAESQMVAAQAAQLAAEAKVQQLTTELEALTKQFKQLSTQAAADKASAETKVADLQKKLEARDKTITQYKDALSKWKAGFEQAQSVANAKEGERVATAEKLLVAERKIVVHETKNREMYRLALEILDQLQKFGLGTALTAREPFIGSMRVKLENYVQDYGDKLATQKLEPEKATNANKAP